MTDGVSDAQFNEALDEAKAEGNLSRANVARKCKAKANPVPLIDENDPEIDAEVQPQPEPEPAQPKKRLTKHTSTEMLANIDGMLHGIVESLPFMDPADIDADANAETIRPRFDQRRLAAGDRDRRRRTHPRPSAALPTQSEVRSVQRQTRIGQRSPIRPLRVRRRR